MVSILLMDFKTLHNVFYVNKIVNFGVYFVKMFDIILVFN